MANPVIRACRRVIRKGAIALVGALVFAAVAMPNATPTQAGLDGGFTSRQVEQIAPGVSFSSGVAVTNGTMRQSIDVATIDTDSAVRIRPLLSNDVIAGRERPTNLAARHSTADSPALVAVNADFWWPGHGSAPRGLHVQGGEVMAAGPLALPTLAIDGRASLRMDAVKLNVTASFPGGRLPVSQVNGGRRPGELVLYTSRVGASTQTDINGTEVLLNVTGRLVPRGSVSGTVVAVMMGSGNTPLGPGQMVLSGSDAAAGQLSRLAVGQNVTIDSAMSDSGWDSVENAVGGDHFLVRHGDMTGYPSANHPRTAIGLTASGDLLVVTVDGRQPGYSYGMSSAELGTLMKQLGAVDAINFDGGSSTTMAVRAPGANKLIVANSPSGGSQRAVTSSLVVFGASTRQVNALAVAADNTPPTTPDGLAANALAYRRTLLTWRDSRDDMTSVLRFVVFRDGVPISTTVRTVFVDRPRILGSHVYTIRALDAAGNWSSAPAPVVVQTSS